MDWYRSVAQGSGAPALGVHPMRAMQVFFCGRLTIVYSLVGVADPSWLPGPALC